MLLLKPDCENCGKDLGPASQEAMICSFECTWCRDCAEGPLSHKCPNCGGALVSRPTRAEALLKDFPASTERIFKG